MEMTCPQCGSSYTHHNRMLDVWECENCGHRFGENQLNTRDLNTPTNKPVKVFLSYPHSSSWICIQIRDALRRRGHDVWFDDKRIHEGNDWRASIADGIDKHRTVVSCLTCDAIREENGTRGVCLDELAIALSTPGCIVQSVLLEPEEDVRPTSAVTHRQWLDMSDWKQMRHQGPDEFKAWFDQKMIKLLEVVESEESRSFAGEVQEVFDLLPYANWHMGKEEKLLGKPFVGRDWLADEVGAWIDDPHGGNLCILWGEPGVGKSAFSVHYSLYNPRVVASINLVYGNMRYNSIDALAQSVAYQLTCRLTDYRQELLRTLRSNKVTTMGSSELVDLLFSRPLTHRHIDGGHEQLCILIDGLDECGLAEENTAVGFIRHLRNHLPHWLRLLVTSRPEGDIRAALRPDRELWLHGGEARNMEDVHRYLISELEHECLVRDTRKLDEVSRALAARSDGIFQFAEAAVESAKLGGFDLYDESSYPTTLDEALHVWFERLFPNQSEYRQKFRLALGAMLASPTPLPEEELERLLGMSEADAYDLLLRVDTLLIRDEDVFGKPTVAFAHRYVAEWLCAGHFSRFHIPIRDALRALATGCYCIAINGTSKLTGYETSNTIQLVQESEMTSELHSLQRCEWLATWSNHYGVSLSISSQRSLELAEMLLRQSIAIRETFAAEQGTQETQLNLLSSLNCLGSMALHHWDLSTANECFERSVRLAKKLDDEMGTPQSSSRLRSALSRMGDVARRRGNLSGAKDYYGRVLELAEEYASECETPEAKLELSQELNRVGEFALRHDDLSAAQSYFERSLILVEEYDAELGTPESKPLLFGPMDALGELAFRRGDHALAEGIYRLATNILEMLVGPETRHSALQTAIDYAESRLRELDDIRHDPKTENEPLEFVAVDENGKKIACEALFLFEREGRNFIVYTDHSEDNEGNIRVFASLYDPEDLKEEGEFGSISLGPITSEEDWAIVETTLEDMQNKEPITTELGGHPNWYYQSIAIDTNNL